MQFLEVKQQVNRLFEDTCMKLFCDLLVIRCPKLCVDLTSCDLNNICATKICWTNTKYLSHETESVVKSICHSIGENVDFESLTLYLLDALENQPNNRKEIVYLINNAILNGE